MDLFVVNRYNGDEIPTASDEKSKLDKVLKKIKKRKLARERRNHELNLKVNKTSKYKIKKDAGKPIKTKVRKGLLLSKQEVRRALKKNILKVEVLAAKLNKGQVIPIKTVRDKAERLIKEGFVEPEILNKDKIKKKKEEVLPNSSKKKRKKSKVNEEPELNETELNTNPPQLNTNPPELNTNPPELNADSKQIQSKSKKLKKNADPDINVPKPETNDVESGFTILGVDKFAKKKTVKRVLPKWLRNPTVISSDLNNLEQKISGSHLNPHLQQKLSEKQINYLFPVQAAFIPWQLKTAKKSGLIAPPDACISAPTGSGKTLAFSVPILQDLLEQLENRRLTIRAIRALIILPTQSLALQIYETFKSLISGSALNVGLATGAGNRPLEAEQRQLITHNSVWGSFSKVDILVCTAGRLVDHLKSSNGFELKHLQYIIIDEADRVLDSIQDDWLYHLGIHLRDDVNSRTNRNIVNVEAVKHRNDPQKLLFSATLSQDPEKLQKLALFQPKLFSCVSGTFDNLGTFGISGISGISGTFDSLGTSQISPNDKTNIKNTDNFIGKYTTPQELTEKYIICTIEIKPLVLYKLIIDQIDQNKKSRILVFVNTMETLHRLNVLLKYMGQEKFTVAEFSSNQGNLNARKTLLKRFEDGLVQVLVCTDSMARGIDVPNVECVISYSVPNHLKTYIHRAGRTARAGQSGLCVSMMHAKQQKTFLGMVENMRSDAKVLQEIQIADEDLEILTPLYEQCLVQLKDKVSGEVERAALRIKTRKLAFNNKMKKRKMRRNSAKKTA